jgi:hypothetical protein
LARLALQTPGEAGTDLQRPAPDGFLREHDPSLEEHRLNQLQAQREADVSQTAWAVISGGKR